MVTSMNETKEIISHVEIIDYEEKYQPDFFALNKQWIERDFPLEDVDLVVLNNPYESILKNGGAILLAKLDEKIVGTCALKKTNEHLFELTKMSVDENYRGRKIGELLCKATIEKAISMGATVVELYSNRNTSAIAVRLYHKLGFKEVELKNKAYARCNIKMELPVVPE
jgi:ribosomal protein S18 acetylase RimI-like enzyme